ncbi:hypothetical protein RHSIM_Rhsim06G0034200 [Rhododendron simsii]|uniref:DUF3741 domain-containing protein n=1 Tax=Rhododendron simsii TaxID=118357 RepID=A0A834GUJ1_RHOSS|nr:hypothetical protein RHSIM_Rhsim06G0034200 [Rhododendron simsii]
MATRSDFAQKLLNDLRMRKERMAASQGSSHSSRMAGEAHGKMSPNYKGSRQMKASQSASSTSRAASSQRRSSNSTRSLNLEETSNQLVPYGGGRNQRQTGDLSMALAIAFEHGAKLTKLDSSGRNSPMLSFLLGKSERSSSFRMSGSSSQFFHTLSQAHINEISKGAQKLNQILRACSNGLSFDGYSIEIGKELLKGAMDLEESLRMLVNLQEAEEYMIPPQRKNRIKLLEEGEEDEESTVKISEQKQVARPRFSFDKPSRKVTNTPSSEDPSLSRKQAVSNLMLVPHKRSASSGPDFRPLAAFSELKDHTTTSQAKTDKGKIPNVIAKLMGLEELPQVADSKSTAKVSSSKQKEETVSKKIPHTSTKNAVPHLSIEKKLVQSNYTGAAKSSSSISESRNIQVARNAISESVVPNGKLLWKDQQSNIGQLYKFMGSQNDFQEARREDNSMHRRQTSMKGEETKQPVQKDDVQKHKTLEAVNKIRGKESSLREEKRNGNRIPPSNPKKPQYDHGMHQQQTQPTSELQEDKNQAENKEQQHAKQKVKFIKQKGIEAEPKDPSQSMHDAIGLQMTQHYGNQEIHNKRSSTEVKGERPLKWLPKSKNQEELSGYGSSTKLKIHMRNSKNGNSDQNAYPRELGSEKDNAKGSIPSIAKEKPDHFPTMRKKDNHMKVHKSESPRNIDEVLTRRNGTLRNSRPLKHQIPILHGMKQKRLEKTSSSKGTEQVSSSFSKEATAQNLRPRESEASIDLQNVALSQNKEGEQAPNLYSSEADELHMQSITQFPIPSETCQSKPSALSAVPIDSQYQAPVFIEGHEQKSLETASSPLTGVDGGNTEITCLPLHEQKDIPTPRPQENLTENEINLKKILIKSQIFLNTAEALFKLNIPFDVLPVTEYSSQDEDSNLVLDCGFEIMKRKGRRQELAVHPHLNISIISMKVTSLDDLVKQIYKDLGKLKFDDVNGCDGYKEAEHQRKMLTRDVQNRDADVNGMWDLGWHEMMFAILEKDELVRDVEKYLLNGVIDEVMKDLLDLSVVLFD